MATSSLVPANPSKANRSAADQAVVFKPVNNNDVDAKSRERRSSLASPESPPQQQHGTFGGNCDTPKPNKAPKENVVGTKRSFEFVEDGASKAKEETQDDEVIGARPSRQCKRPSAASSLKLATPKDDEDSDLGSEDDVSRHSKVEAKGSSKVVPPPDTRHKGPCSYEYCPNPTHSSGGGFKVVSDETKAGARDWSMYTGRVFCNACFTQYATRGTLQRPGRILASAAPASVSAASSPPAATASPAHHQAAIADHDHGRPAAHGGHYKQLAPEPPARLPVFLDLEDGLKKGQACLEMTLCCAGGNLEYQWMRDGKPIPGATRPSLLLEHPAQVTGDFTCKVSNGWGVTTPFVPITFPLSVSDAEERFATPFPTEVPTSTHYQLTCVCGVVRVGKPSELVDECSCGLQVCGEVVPVTNPA